LEPCQNVTAHAEGKGRGRKGEKGREKEGFSDAGLVSFTNCTHLKRWEAIRGGEERGAGLPVTSWRGKKAEKKAGRGRTTGSF